MDTKWLQTDHIMHVLFFKSRDFGENGLALLDVIKNTIIYADTLIFIHKSDNILR